MNQDSESHLIRLIQTYTLLRKASHGYVGCCPFHDEKTPSFVVKPKREFFHCYSCGAHGETEKEFIQLLQEKE